MYTQKYVPVCIMRVDVRVYLSFTVVVFVELALLDGSIRETAD